MINGNKNNSIFQGVFSVTNNFPKVKREMDFGHL